MNTQAEKIRLIQQARDTWVRLDNQYDLLFASSPDPFELGYFSAVCHRAYNRYMRRVNAFAVAYPGVDCFALETQQIAAAVEREAFPKSDYCLTCQQHIDDAASCNHPHCEVKPNSGDSARHPAGAPVLSSSADQSIEVGQGGTQFNPPPSCLALEPRFAYSCDCPECSRFNALMLSEVEFAL